jgi:membrane-associated protease RseP (regulator of RpoE activity)
MTRYRAAVLALALLGALAPRVHAQEGMLYFDSPRRAWLGFSYERTETRRPGETTLTLNVVAVTDDSPAAKAGLKKGDTILRINNLGASQQLLGSLGSSLTPGDTVVFHIRRDGREQDLRIIAAQPPANWSGNVMIRVRPDSVRKLVEIFTDSMRKNMDSTVFRYLSADSALRRYTLRIDSLRPFADSAFRHLYIYGDSMGPGFEKARIELLRSRGGRDSLTWRIEADSLFFGGAGARGSFVFSGRPGEDMMVRPFMVGMRAVAGAELQELNPELARYFKVDDGLLVVNAAPNSPARRAGLQAGDVITSVDGRQVTTVAQLRRAIEQVDGRAVKLEVVREGAKRTVELPR